MINSIILSSDGAIYLHLLLESIEKNAQGVFKLNVLFKYNNEESKLSYFKLMTKFPQVNWIVETDIKRQTLELINTDLKHTCFFWDSDIIYNKVEESLIECFDNDDFFCFSLKLGENIKKNKTLHCDNILIPESQDDKYIWWNWSKHYADFGDALSCHGHIFRTNEIKKLVRATNFSDIISLEMNLQNFDTYPKEIMASYKKSVLVINTEPVKEGDKMVMEDNYLDYNKFDFSNIISCNI